MRRTPGDDKNALHLPEDLDGGGGDRQGGAVARGPEHPHERTRAGGGGGGQVNLGEPGAGEGIGGR